MLSWWHTPVVHWISSLGTLRLHFRSWTISGERIFIEVFMAWLQINFSSYSFKEYQHGNTAKHIDWSFSLRRWNSPVSRLWSELLSVPPEPLNALNFKLHPCPNKWHYNISYFMKNHMLSSIIKPYSSHVTNIVYIIIVIKCHTYNYKYTIIYTHHTTIRSPSAFSPKPLPVHFKLHVVLSVATSPKYSTNDTQIPLGVISCSCFVLYIVSKPKLRNFEKTRKHKTDPERELKLFPLVSQQLTCLFGMTSPPPEHRLSNDLFKFQDILWLLCKPRVSTRPKRTNSGTWSFSKPVASPPSCTCTLLRGCMGSMNQLENTSISCKMDQKQNLDYKRIA